MAYRFRVIILYLFVAQLHTDISHGQVCLTDGAPYVSVSPTTLYRTDTAQIFTFEFITQVTTELANLGVKALSTVSSILLFICKLAQLNSEVDQDRLLSSFATTSPIWNNLCYFELATVFQLVNTIVSFEVNDLKKIGAGLITFGIVFSFMGLVLFFDKRLLGVGNTLFVSGLIVLVGLKSTMQFLVKPQNLKGTISFSAGFLFVVMGWAIFGMILEASGFLMLFSGYWPTMAFFLQRIPILGWLLQHSYVRSFFDRYDQGGRMPI